MACLFEKTHSLGLFIELCKKINTFRDKMQIKD